MPGKPRKIKLLLAYDGTHFVGWQRQRSARTIQAVLEETLGKIVGGKRVLVTGAGRTDSGVHAQGQVAHALIRSALSAQTIFRALNATLQEDLVVRRIEEVPASFHAQYSAKTKRYRYTIWNHPIRPIADRQTVVHIPTPLNLRQMKQAARLLAGKHDFKAFHSTGRTVSTTRRTLQKLTVRKEKGKLFIEAQANGFLYHMVRRLTGLLIEVGKGKIQPEEVRLILRGKSHVIPPTAPPKGLSLVEIRY